MQTIAAMIMSVILLYPPHRLLRVFAEGRLVPPDRNERVQFHAVGFDFRILLTDGPCGRQVPHWHGIQSPAQHFINAS